MLIKKLIRLTGWSGIVIGLIAVLTKNIELFLIWQLIANICGFLWSNYLQGKPSWDTTVSLIITVIAVFTKDPFFVYSSMLIRAISYQFVFEKIVKQRKENGQ